MYVLFDPQLSFEVAKAGTGIAIGYMILQGQRDVIHAVAQDSSTRGGEIFEMSS